MLKVGDTVYATISESDGSYKPEMIGLGKVVKFKEYNKHPYLVRLDTNQFYMYSESELTRVCE